MQVAVDACVGASSDDNRRALDAMALSAPLIELTNLDRALEQLLAEAAASA